MVAPLSLCLGDLVVKKMLADASNNDSIKFPEQDEWVRALASGELGPAQIRMVCAGIAEMIVARLEDGSVAACVVECPHQRYDLSGGRIIEGTIECPLHNYRYDLRTGENRHPRKNMPHELRCTLKSLRLFPAEEREGWVWVRPR